MNLSTKRPADKAVGSAMPLFYPTFPLIHLLLPTGLLTTTKPDESASLSDSEQSKRSSAHGSPSPGMFPAGHDQH
ncbi:hypothetical protein BJ508DRAFT_337029 [Ascobolus immersus RN42]|uniref:Uncharacterized protein n=1 Tax=Ascobolus immersus RN42 TaxID=1160509 RepID=A0A3N4HEH7_ASCIM|nr:hypothetical protein BJ508DRAFT_337029 [Ascobolus immersus RN42]